LPLAYVYCKFEYGCGPNFFALKRNLWNINQPIQNSYNSILVRTTRRYIAVLPEHLLPPNSIATSAVPKQIFILSNDLSQVRACSFENIKRVYMYNNYVGVLQFNHLEYQGVTASVV
jgi:hypothetical protein